MLLEEYVDIPICGNRSYWENLGYEISIIKDCWGRYSVKSGTKIKVKIKDLPPKSRTKVKRKCDNCGKVDEVRWYAYRNICLKCGNKLFPKKGYSLDQVQKIFEKNECKLISNKYIRNDKKLKYICKCGRESKIILGNFLMGQRCKDCGIEKSRLKRIDYSLTDEDRNRRVLGYSKFIKLVKKRDDYTCQKCEYVGEKLDNFMVCHHIESWNSNKDLRIEIENGITFCKDCHRHFHKIFGKGNNTKKQLIIFTGEY